MNPRVTQANHCFSLLKLSVAPESTRTCLSAVVCDVSKRVGIHSDLYLQAKTLLIPKVCAQAVGVAPFKNPNQPLSPAQHPQPF
jgi:hypothetical protein